MVGVVCVSSSIYDVDTLKVRLAMSEYRNAVKHGRYVLCVKTSAPCNYPMDVPVYPALMFNIQHDADMAAYDHNLANGGTGMIDSYGTPCTVYVRDTRN